MGSSRGDLIAAVQFVSFLYSTLLDDADASHAEAAQHMSESGDWVTLKVNGIRYLEKATSSPTGSMRPFIEVFGQNAFATHLPNALALLGCAWLGRLWAGRAWGRRGAGLWPAPGILTAIGPFLGSPASPFPKRC